MSFFTADPAHATCRQVSKQPSKYINPATMKQIIGFFENNQGEPEKDRKAVLDGVLSCPDLKVIYKFAKACSKAKTTGSDGSVSLHPFFKGLTDQAALIETNAAKQKITNATYDEVKANPASYITRANLSDTRQFFRKHSGKSVKERAALLNNMLQSCNESARKRTAKSAAASGFFEGLNAEYYVHALNPHASIATPAVTRKRTLDNTAPACASQQDSEDELRLLRQKLNGGGFSTPYYDYGNNPTEDELRLLRQKLNGGGFSIPYYGNNTAPLQETSAGAAPDTAFINRLNETFEQGVMGTPYYDPENIFRTLVTVSRTASGTSLRAL